MAISIVQTVPVSNGTSSSTTLSFTLTATGAGNSIILALGYEYSANETVTSVKLGTVSLAQNVSQENSTYHGYAQAWSLDNIASGQTSLVVTFPNASYSAGVAFEVSGLLSTGSFDTSAVKTASSGKPVSVGPTATLAQASEIVFGNFNGFSTSTITGPVASSTFTATNASPCVFTPATATGFTNNTAVTLTGGSLPAGFSTGTTYYIVSASTTTFELASAVGGTALGSASTGTGTVTPSAPWTNEANQTWYTGSDINSICSYQIVSSAGAVTYEVSPNTSNYYAGCVATYKAAAAPPPAAVVAPVRPLFVSAAVSRASNW